MVHRRLTANRLLRLGLGLVAALLLGGLAAAPVGAANTRVSITDFAWSQEPTVDLGEKVIWDFLGPDLQHSVTGQAPNASQWDSDPGITSPMQPLGRTFEVTFDEPGAYLFICKVHPQAVRGTVTVTNQPGDPNSDPGPQPPLRFDLEPPFVEMVKLRHTVLGPRGRGTVLEFENSKRGTTSVDYYRVITRGRGRHRRNIRRFAGYNEGTAHIGLNAIRVAYRSPTFRARPGRYVAIFRVDDETTNSSPDFPVRFEIKAPKRPRNARRPVNRRSL